MIQVGSMSSQGPHEEGRKVKVREGAAMREAKVRMMQGHHPGSAGSC